MEKKTGLILVLCAMVCLYSCTKDKTSTAPAVDCTGVNASTNTYTQNIGPNIVDVYCNYSPCHDAGTASQGIDMSNYNGVVNSFKNTTGHGSVVCAITNGGCELMPKGGPALPDSLIKHMKCWQANGYPQ